MRPLGFCRYLEEYGWRPRVLTTEPRCVYPPVGVDQSLTRNLPTSIVVDRVPHRNPEQMLLHLRSKFRELRGVGCTVANGIAKPGSEELDSKWKQYRDLKDLVLQRLFSFPDPQCYWRRPAVKSLSRIPKSEYPDVVLATGGPWTGLIVGQSLARQFRVPFVADFRDPWTCNPYNEIFPTSLFNKAARLERSVYEAAARVITNNSELCAKLKVDHSDLQHKFVTITNGFDGGTYSGLQPKNWTSSAGIELRHFGSVYGKRSPLILLQAVKELFDEKRVRPRQLRLRFVGAWDVMDTPCENLAGELEERGILQRDPPVPHDRCIQLMMDSPVLLILQPASPLQIPAKIYEYIATGRPLLVIGGEGATAHLVEKHRLGACCRNEVSDIKTMLSQLTGDKKQIKALPTEEKARFDYRTLAGQLASVLDGASGVRRVS